MYLGPQMAKILFDSRIRDNADTSDTEINDLHKSLTFTRERKHNGSLPMLDMSVYNNKGRLSSTWYCKPSDTGLILNYHALLLKDTNMQLLQVLYIGSTEHVIHGNFSIRVWLEQKLFLSRISTQCPSLRKSSISLVSSNQKKGRRKRWEKISHT